MQILNQFGQETGLEDWFATGLSYDALERFAVNTERTPESRIEQLEDEALDEYELLKCYQREMPDFSSFLRTYIKRHL